MTYSCNNWQHKKKSKVSLKISEVAISHITNRGKARVMLHIEVAISHITNREKARVMLHIGAGQSNNSQIIL